MTKVYVVIGDASQWDDSERWLVAYSPERTKAHALAGVLNAAAKNLSKNPCQASIDTLVGMDPQVKQFIGMNLIGYSVIEVNEIQFVPVASIQ